MRVIVMAIGLALAAGPAFATETAAPSATAKADDADTVICKKRVRANSRFVARQCLTKAEWDAQAETARKAWEEVQNRPNVFIDKGN